ncbi:PYR-1 protein [Aphelenchoides avenae]|nr:PYR-1 protein [Aphelenchus avenae]
MDVIDCFATDHAPHTREEKASRDDKGVPCGPPGFPGVEHMLPLLLTEVARGRLTMKQLVDRLYHNPRRIFGLPEQKDTYVEVDMAERWTVPENGGHSLAGWTPYAGREVRGRVVNVVLRGEEVLVDGQLVGKPGAGRNVRLVSEVLAADGATVNDSSTRELAPTRRGASEQRASPEESPRHSPSPVRHLRDNQLVGRSVLDVEMFSKEMINRVFHFARKFRDAVNGDDGLKLKTVLENRAMAAVFYEESTRTKSSFRMAMKRLGGMVEELDAKTSSVQKGESLEDTIRTMDAYVGPNGIIVLRHPEKGAAERAAKVANCPVINAGDGTGQHPTQALLDVYTIQDEMGSVHGKTVALVGDLKHGRTVHSLAKLLCLFKDITIHYVAPVDELQIPQSVWDYVAKYGQIKQVRFTDLEEGIADVDVIYMTRVQKERFSDLADYERVKDTFILKPHHLEESAEAADNVLRPQHHGKPIVMHPLPRVNEISVEVDADPRAAYFRQERNGMYVRMALLALVFGADENVV